MDSLRLCQWCEGPIPAEKHRAVKYCSEECVAEKERVRLKNKVRQTGPRAAKEQRTCANELCGREFEQTNVRQRYCSTLCKTRTVGRTYQRANHVPKERVMPTLGPGKVCAFDGCRKPLPAESYKLRRWCDYKCCAKARRYGPRRLEVLQNDRRYREANKEICNEAIRRSSYRRRAAKDAVVENFSTLGIYRRDRWICGICKESVDRTLRFPHAMSPSLDHIRPLARGGEHTQGNVQLAHLACNQRKNAQWVEKGA